VHAHSHGSLFDHDHDHDHSHSHGGHEHEHSHTRANAHSQGEHGHSHGGCEESGEHVHIAGSQHDLQQAATRGSLSVRATRQSNAEAPPQGAMNQRAALLHVFGDCLQALGVVVAAGLTWAGNEWKHHTSSTAHSFFNLADPLLSLAFGIITICTTKHLVKETWQILMERVPPVLSYADFVDELLLEDAVSEVLDLHIWMVGPSLSVLCATLSTAEELPPVEAQRLVERLTDRCMEMGAQHCTFQLEYSQHARTDDAPMQA
jgi:solute carrier family 30 (zinc transporter), member 2